MTEPNLYGLSNSNRKGKNLWGKNQFNSNFPVALSCYMRDHGIKPVYLTLDRKLEIVPVEISFDEVFNSTAPNEELEFHFESKFEPYQSLAYDDIKGIDLTIRSKSKWLRALEIKLTVLPDNSTFYLAEENWGSEIVVRPATTSYCALGMAYNCLKKMGNVREIFEDLCSNIQHWHNHFEIYSKRNELLKAIDTFQLQFLNTQTPFLMQPIWKTKGNSPILDDNAFDVFIWSDFALCRLFLDSKSRKKNRVDRYLRSSARLARILYEISRSGKANLTEIYREMSFGHQTDKEFAVNGKRSAPFMNSPRRTNPILGPSVLKEIILNGGQKELSPERRFDQTIYYTAEILFGDD